MLPAAKADTKMIDPFMVLLQGGLLYMNKKYVRTNISHYEE